MRPAGVNDAKHLGRTCVYFCHINLTTWDTANVRLPAHVQIAPVTDRYPLVFGKLIPRRKKSDRDSHGKSTALVRSVHCVEQQRSVLIVVSSN